MKMMRRSTSSEAKAARMLSGERRVTSGRKLTWSSSESESSGRRKV
jgi:hypothetical protein